MSARLKQVLGAIDSANARDTGRDEATDTPAALLYGQRMSARLAAFAHDPSDALQIAVRGQHIERWTIFRNDFPAGRVGYLRWRNELKEFHAKRLGDLMTEAGYDRDTIARVSSIVRKEDFRSDADGQTCEDVACLVFLEFYAPDFAAKHDEAKVIDIVRKTWRKMSAAGHEAARRTTLTPAVAAIVTKALAVG